MVLIGELKQITRTTYGSRLVIKHVPDRAFRDERCQRQARDESRRELGARPLGRAATGSS
jgi:hypothetical protein